jgi:photosystem II stability/assembly factor-like uncharacterized protein
MTNIFKNISRVLGFFFITTSFLFAAVKNTAELDVSKIFFTEIKKVGDSVFVVGENGIILSSDDNMRSWVQHEIQKKSLFTSFDFVDDRRGIFVGHDSMLYVTTDGGTSFTKISVSPEENPISLLKVKWIDESQVIVAGSFGLVLTSKDGGFTWKKESFKLKGFDRHIYDILVISSGVFLIGESGTIFFKRKKSNDWIKINSPYIGSLFGGLIVKDKIYFYGMRGNILRTKKIFFVKEKQEKLDVVFERFQMPSKIGIMNANLSPKKKLYFFGNGGVSYQFDGDMFKKKRFNLNTVVSSTIINRALILVGMRGIQKLK